MPPRKKRSNEDMSEHSQAKKSKSFFEPTNNKRASNDNQFTVVSCMYWLNQYTMKERNMGPEGIEKLCKDLNIDPDDIVMLVLAHLMNAKRMGYFTREEWGLAMIGLGCDSTEKLKGKLPYLRSLLKDPPTFKSIYRFAFGFSLEEGHKSLDIPTSISMLHILLNDRWPLCKQFFTFLKNSRHQVLNRDQWNNILEFSRQVLPDLSNYEEDGAWPVLLDEFVEWIKNGAADSIATSDSMNMTTPPTPP